MVDLDKYGEMDENNNLSSSRYICPGCGERATAKDDAYYCSNCESFVCSECMTVNLTCPICNLKLIM